MALPKYKRARPASGSAVTLEAMAELVARVEDNVASFADALTDERVGLLSRGLTFREHFKGRVFTATITVPDEWTPFTSFLNGTTSGATVHPQFGVPGVRCDQTGTVEARGILLRTTDAVGNLPAVVVPDGYGTRADGDRRFVCEALGSYACMEVIPPNQVYPHGALQHTGGANTRFIDLSACRWRAASGPIAWPDSAQVTVTLGADFSGEPGQVFILAARAADGLTVSGPIPCQWRATTTAGVKGVRLRRLEGLAPQQKYTLTLAVFPG